MLPLHFCVPSGLNGETPKYIRKVVLAGISVQPESESTRNLKKSCFRGHKTSLSHKKFKMKSS